MGSLSSLRSGSHASARFLVLAAFVGPTLVSAALAAGPNTITYQGTVWTPGGTAAEGSFAMRFALHDSPTEDSPRWQETREGPNAVPVSGGAFAVELGSVAPFPDGLFADAPNLWLEMAIDLDANGFDTGEVYSPRAALTASAYAFQADSADSGGGGAGDAWMLLGNAGTTSATHFLGTTDNRSLVVRVNNRRVLLLQPVEGEPPSPNIVGGFEANEVSPGVCGATIGGGGEFDAPDRHLVTDSFGTIGGGGSNQAGDGDDNPDSAPCATVGGGDGNVAGGSHSTVAGGTSNRAEGNESAVGGGALNTASGYDSAVAGGYRNRATGDGAFVGAGEGNLASGYCSVVPGGKDNVAASDRSLAAGSNALADHRGTFVWSDNSGTTFSSTAQNQFAVRATGGFLFDADGDGAGWRILGSDGNANLIGGAPGNEIFANVTGGVIAGGGSATYPNLVTDDHGTVGGGFDNQAGDHAGETDDAKGATVGGGGENEASANYAVVSGGFRNKATESISAVAGGSGNEAGGAYGFIGGGRSNSLTGTKSAVAGGENNAAGGEKAFIGAGEGNQTSADHAAVVGGQNNTASGAHSAVGGGEDNDATGAHSFIGGGDTNEATATGATVGGGLENNAKDIYATVGGGRINDATNDYATVAGGFQNKATGTYAAVGGGEDNSAIGSNATVPGGYNNRASASNTFAAGKFAHAVHSGAMVFNCGGASAYESTASNQFIVRAPGGVGMGTNSPTNQLHVVESVNSTANASNHVVLIENSSTGTSPDVLALKTNRSVDPDSANNFISFFNGADAVGAIEGNGSGGIYFRSGSGDFAEFMPRRDADERLVPGDIVGLHADGVSLDTRGARRAFVVPTAPIILGRQPDPAREHLYARVALMGQVSVKVRGTVRAGDLVVASGRGDGTGVGVPTEEMEGMDLRRGALVVGRALTGWEGEGVGRIDALVGVADEALALGLIAARDAFLTAQQDQIAEQRDRIRAQQRQIDALRRELDNLKTAIGR